MLCSDCFYPCCGYDGYCVTGSYESCDYSQTYVYGTSSDVSDIGYIISFTVGGVFILTFLIVCCCKRRQRLNELAYNAQNPNGQSTTVIMA